MEYGLCQSSMTNTLLKYRLMVTNFLLNIHQANQHLAYLEEIAIGGDRLQRFHHYYGDDFKVECPTGSGKYLTLLEISDEISRRLSNLFLSDDQGIRPVFGHQQKMQSDPHFKNYILFYEYFHGDNGRGVGASHQTGWTGLIAKLLQPRHSEGSLKKQELKVTTERILNEG
jgi:hypothetical protein